MPELIFFADDSLDYIEEIDKSLKGEDTNPIQNLRYFPKGKRDKNLDPVVVILQQILCSENFSTETFSKNNTVVSLTLIIGTRVLNEPHWTFRFT